MGRGVRLTVIGVVLGILCGIGIRSLERYLAKQIQLALEDEVVASCECTFAIQKLRVSLLTLSASGTGAEIREGGTPKLSIGKLRASVSLLGALDRVVTIKRLRLSDAHVSGFGEQSVLYRFIDQLTEPAPPEKDDPGRIHIELARLSLDDATLDEQFSSGFLRASDASLEVLRLPDGDFRLDPKIKRLAFHFSSGSSPPLQLGVVQGRVYLRDFKTIFSPLRYQLIDTVLKGRLTSYPKEGNRLEGAMKGFVRPGDFTPLSIFAGGLALSTKASGTLGLPLFNFSGQMPEKDPFRITAFPGDPLVPSDLSLHGSLEITPDGLIGKIFRLQSHGDEWQAGLSDPIVFDQDEFRSGKISLSVQSGHLGDTSFRDLHIDLSPRGDISSPKYHIASSIGTLQYMSIPLSNVTIDGVFGQDLLTLSLVSPTGAVKALVNLDVTSGIQLKDSSLHFEGLALDTSNDPLRTSGNFSASGDLLHSKWEGRGDFLLRRSKNVLEGHAILSPGEIQVQAHDPLQPDSRFSLSVRPEESWKRFSLESSVNLLSLESVDPSYECLQIIGNFTYSGSTDAPLAGNGNLALSSVNFGCGPSPIYLKSPTNIPIHNGHAKIAPLVLVEPRGEIHVSGSVDLQGDVDVTLSGYLLLSSLLDFIPGIDDLRGGADIALTIKGATTAPEVSGNIQIHRASISDESLGLSASEIEGALELKKNLIRISSLEGVLNSGRFVLTGTILPKRIEQSNLELVFEDLTIEPTLDASVSASGRLELQTDDFTRSILRGQIVIDRAEFQRSFQISQMLAQFPRWLFLSNTASREIGDTSALPDIQLAITIEAPSDLFIITNFFGVELHGLLSLNGKIADPLLEGGLETLRGWFGIRGRRFEVTSGKIRFEPPSNEPTIDLTSETYARTPTGDSVLIILEANGPLLRPRVTLSSAQDYTQAELLSYISSLDPASSSTRANASFEGLVLDDQSDADSLFGIGSLIQRITTLDSLQIEPRTNPFRGQVEPAVVAKKELLPRLRIIGESFFSSAQNEARLSAQYDLAENVRLEGSVETGDANQQTSFGTDLTFTILARQRRFLDVSVVGNDKFSKRDILRSQRITPFSRIPNKELPSLKRKMEQFFKARGYESAKVETTCTRGITYCRVLEISIYEGPQYTIHSVSLQGDALPSEVPSSIQRQIQDFAGTPATAETRAEIEALLRSALRNEGYLEARVQAAFVPSDTGESLIAEVKLFAGRPVSFVFQGQHAFSERKLLETIHLFDRTQPFGNNTIRILVQNISKLYLAKGYRDVSVEYERSSPQEADRTTYTISISEGPQYEVKDVRFSGLNSISRKSVLEHMGGLTDTLEWFLHPTYPVDTEMNQGSVLVRQALAELGYPNATVTVHYEPQDDTRTGIIVYQIEEGQREHFQSVVVQGVPDTLTSLIVPLGAVSSVTASQFIQQTYSSLESAGFTRALVSSRLEGSSLIVKIDAGEPSTIASIEVQGATTSNKEIIQSALGIQPGDRLDQGTIEEGRRRILRIGLFSRVDIEQQSTDRVLQQRLIVRVEERPTQTLELGGGINSEYGFHGFGEFTDRGFFRDGRTLSLRFDGYLDEITNRFSRGSAGVRYQNPTLLKSEYSHSEDLRIEKFKLDNQEFDLDRVSVTSSLYKNISNGRSLSFSHNLFREDLSNVTPDAILSDLDSGMTLLSFATVQFTLDRRDNPLLPRRGYQLVLDAKTSSAAIGSDANFAGGGARFAFLHPFSIRGERFAVANNSRVASLWALHSSSEIPITQRFYLGGRSSVRGFRENSLGPRGDEGAILGGDMLALDNLELRYFPSEDFETHLFYDVGNVFLRARDVRVSDLRHSAGIGIRYLSPIGPIGFDIGHPLDEKQGEPSVRFHFVVGTTF